MSSDYPYEGATFGDYRFIRGLGRGGFADVYLGTDISLGKSVAIKVMNTRVPRHKQEEAVSALAWSPQERVLALGTDDGRMSIRTMQGDTVLSIKVSSNPANVIA
jgi:serine/threonine protein kinase